MARYGGSVGRQYGGTYGGYLGNTNVLRKISEGSAHSAPEPLSSFYGGGGKLTLRQLANNYKGYHKRSIYHNLVVLDPVVGSTNTLQLNIRTEVKSSVNEFNYQTWIVLRRKTLNDTFTIDSKCEVRCQCPAFNYYAAYADIQSSNFAGNPKKWNKVPAPIRNPYSLPILCKHITAATYEVVRRKIIQ
jgi:hypothetical protein